MNPWILFCSLFFSLVYSQIPSQKLPAKNAEIYGICQDSGISLPYFHSKASPSKCSVLILGGIHGNEPAGSLAALELIEKWKELPEAKWCTITIIPQCNPTGLKRKRRHNQNQKDLNRKFRDQTQAETRLIQRIAARFHPYDLLLDLHEDGRAPGAYLYELTRPEGKPFRKKIFENYPKKRLVPIDLAGNHTYFQKAIGGVATYGKGFYNVSQISGMPWSSIMWGTIELKILRAYTIETPKRFPLKKRIQTSKYLARILIQLTHLDLSVQNSKESQK